MRLFFAAERVRLIASTINWRFSHQRFYALINTHAYVSVDVDEVDAEVDGDIGVDDTAEVDVCVRNDALRATWRLVGKLGRGHHRILSDQVFAKQRN